MILVLIGLVGQTMGYRVFDVKRSEKRELGDLLRTLGDILPRSPKSEYLMSAKPEAHRVADMLAETKDKETEIFNHLTINQLLALNEWTLDDCTEVKLEERRETCLKLCTEKFLYMIGGFLIDLPEPTKGDELVPYNLGQYCWHIFKRVRSECPTARVEAAKSKFVGWLKKDAWRLSNFEKQIEKHIADQETSRILIAATRKAIYREAAAKIFAKKKESDRDSFRKLCKKLVDELGELPKTYIIGQDLRDHYNLCKIIIDI